MPVILGIVLLVISAFSAATFIAGIAMKSPLLIALGAIVISGCGTALIVILMRKNENQADPDEAIKKKVRPDLIDKELEEKSKTGDELNKFSDFMEAVVALGFEKKLYLMIAPTETGLSLLHQNPGTKDTFIIMENIILPEDKPGSNGWKACMARTEEAMDDFIANNKDKIILEDMKIDVEA